MRTSKYKKKSNLTKKQKQYIMGGIGACLLAGVIFFFTYFRVTEVEVMGSNRYTEKEIRSMILRGPMAGNSILAPLLYSNGQTEGIPFVEAFTVSRSNRNTLVIGVKEKKAVGCIPYLDSYIYFDRNGIFIEGEKTRDEKIPFFDGISVKKVVRDEPLPIKETVLNTAVALSTIFAKNDSMPDHIVFDENYEISLLYGDITVNLGKDVNLEDKMSRVIAILPQISGEKGILHAENVSSTVKNITFEAEVEEVTAENWTGGYDENGEYTGDGVYDENGKYVGEKPKSALDYALEAWPGGYDEEGDYTGSGEYDVNWNYVGPAPTQELIDSFGDWTGGYTEDGSFTGSGEYDREGNYIGPNPNLSEESQEEENGDGSYEEDGSYEGDGSYEEDGSYEDYSEGYEDYSEEEY